MMVPKKVKLVFCKARFVLIAIQWSSGRLEVRIPPSAIRLGNLSARGLEICRGKHTSFMERS